MPTSRSCSESGPYFGSFLLPGDELEWLIWAIALAALLPRTPSSPLWCGSASMSSCAPTSIACGKVSGEGVEPPRPRIASRNSLYEHFPRRLRHEDQKRFRVGPRRTIKALAIVLLLLIDTNERVFDERGRSRRFPLSLPFLFGSPFLAARCSIRLWAQISL